MPIDSHNASTRRFMLGFSLVAAALALAGSSGTFLMPLAQHTFFAPWFVFVHGALFFTWICLLVAQSTLVAYRKISVHRRLGQIAVVFIPLLTLSSVAVALWSAASGYGAGQENQAIVALLGELMDTILFAGFATTAILLRGQPQWHRRMILFATLALLDAAMERIPVLGTAANYIVVTLVLAIVAYDVALDGRLHAATLIAGIVLFVGIPIENRVNSTSRWLALGTQLVTRVHYESDDGLPSH
jgi:hypothetical protein